MLSRFFFCFALFIAGISATAQSDKFRFVSNHDFVGSVSGIYSGKYTALHNQLESWGMRSRPQFNLFAGISRNLSLRMSFSDAFWDASIGFEMMIPETILKNDSLQMDFRGWHIISSLYGKDIIPGDAVALVLAPGVEWGATKIRYNLNNEKLKYRNGIVAPFARAELRFKIGSLILGARTCWRYDLTNPHWNSSRFGMPELRETRFSGFSYQFILGWQLKFENSNPAEPEIPEEPED